MIAWICDRCEAQQPVGTRKNKRPDQWTTVRRQDGQYDPKGTSYLLCESCAKSFQDWLDQK